METRQAEYKTDMAHLAADMSIPIYVPIHGTLMQRWFLSY